MTNAVSGSIPEQEGPEAGHGRPQGHQRGGLEQLTPKARPRITCGAEWTPCDLLRQELIVCLSTKERQCQNP